MACGVHRERVAAAPSSSPPPRRTRSPQWTPPGRATGRPRSTRQGKRSPTLPETTSGTTRHYGSTPRGRLSPPGPGTGTSGRKSPSRASSLPVPRPRDPLAGRPQHQRQPADRRRPHDAADPVDTAAVSAIAASPLRTTPARKFTALTPTVTTGLAQARAARTRRRWQGSASWPAAPCSSASGRTRSRTRCGCSARNCGWGSRPRPSATRTARSPPAQSGRLAATSTSPLPARASRSGRLLRGHHQPAGPGAPPRGRRHRRAGLPGARRWRSPRWLTSAWDSIRTRSLGPAEAAPVIAEILRARHALPSQWLPGLTARPLAEG